MIFLPHEKAKFYDCDDTLVMWEDSGFMSPGDGKLEFEAPYSGGLFFLKPHKRHIKHLEVAHDQGYFVVVWSAGGALWAKEVVHKLCLTDKVGLVMTKPLIYVDDLPADAFMERVYLKDE